VAPGTGNAESMSDIEPAVECASVLSRLSFSELENMSSIPNLLAVFPRSRFAANLVALRIRSGRLVRLPRASVSLTISRSRRGGRRLDGLLSLIEGRASKYFSDRGLDLPSSGDSKGEREREP
jgi:hypothetical protein